jgi:translocation and assembly module TamA
VDPETNRADVALTLAGGDRYRIGDIAIDQQELNPELFGRLLRIETGRTFDARDLAATYRNLLSSQYFDRVLVTPDVDARADGAVPVRVTAMATNRRYVLLGAGFATDSGPRARADLRNRRLNDRGHRANVSTIVSGIQGEVSGEYRIPYGDPANEWLFLESALTYEDVDTYVNRLWKIGAGRTYLRWDNWAETDYVSYRDEDFDVGGERGHSQLLLIGSNLTRKSLTDDPRPLSGYALSIDVRGAAQALLSDNDLVQAIGRARHIFPLGKRVRVLSRATAGWTWQQKFDDLPPSIRFFAGGDNSVRGYDFESIGPEEDGEVVGGRRLLTGSIELDVLIRERWSAALFADAGSAFDDSPDFRRSLGFGVRWFSPLGPLRLDFAHPLDDVDRSLRIHVSLGPDL